MEKWVIGVDLGGTKVELGLVDPHGRIAGRRRIATLPGQGAASLIERMAAEVEALRQMTPVGAQVAALGICSPGPVDHVAGKLLDPPNLQGLHFMPLADLLRERVGLPVALEHDAKTAALGDFHFGAGRGSRDMAFVVVGTGVGAAFIMDGQVYRGRHNSAGEIGHTTLDRNGELCSCGNRGCVETFISGPWIVRRYARAANLAPETVTGEQVTRAAVAGDALARRTLAEAGQALGVAVATMAMTVDIDLFVIGGSVAKAGEFLLQPARAAAPAHCIGSVGARVRIIETALHDDGPLLGCAWLARGIG